MRESNQYPFEARGRSWLECRRGSAPVLLIAPHGGRARGTPLIKGHPKVNDLHTDELTRALASRLAASAIINSGMDRNHLDCNRISQLLAGAPWMLNALAYHAEELVKIYRRLVVLIIHGWNVIQPRVDFGIGARLECGCAPPTCADRLSASDSFVKNVLFPLTRRLGECGIIASFGLRYPGASKDNLLQAFTRRHQNSDVPSLRRLAELARAGAIEAAQIELSVPLRWPGPLRARVLSCVEQALLAWIEELQHGKKIAAVVPAPRLSPTMPLRAGRISERTGLPFQSFRYGMEFYDPAVSIGGIASFRFGGELARASLLLLCEGRRVVMFSTEDRVCLRSNGISLGGLQLELSLHGFELRFHGAAIDVPDARCCISIEQALASGHLLEISLCLNGYAGSCGAATRIDQLLYSPQRASVGSRFGRARGQIKLGVAVYTVDALGRVGFGPNYESASVAPRLRKNLWVYLEGAQAPVTLETELFAPNGPDIHTAAYNAPAAEFSQRWNLQALELVATIPGQFPEKLIATLELPGATQQLALVGTVEKTIALTHPGPRDVVTYTTLGFAMLESRLGSGYGTFWLSDSMRPLWVSP
jgi:hypothetical protein